MSRDHYKGVPKNRDARISADGKLRPLSKNATNPAPSLFNVGNEGAQFVKFRDDGLTVNVYVDDINGDDSHSGLSKAEALKTLTAVQIKFPIKMLNKSRTIVNLVNDTASQIIVRSGGLTLGGGDEGIVNGYVYRGPAMKVWNAGAALDSTPAVRVNQAGTGSGTGNRTRLDFTSASPGWAVNNFREKFLRVTRNGALVFNEIPITANTADTLFVDCLNIVGSILATDTVEIVEPAVRIVGDVSSFNLAGAFGNNNAPFANLIPDEMGATFERLAFGDLYVLGVYGLQFDRCVLSDEGASGSVFIGGSVSFVNCATEWDLLLMSSSGWPATGRSDDAPLVATAKVGLNVFNGSLVIGNVGGADVAGTPGSYSSTLPTAVYGNTRNSGNAVTVWGKASAFVTTASVTGNGNSGVGILCIHGGTAYIPGGNLVAITGTGGDLKVGTGAVISYGTGSGDFEEAAGFNGNFTRRLEGTAAAPTGDDSVITSKALSFI